MNTKARTSNWLLLLALGAPLCNAIPAAPAQLRALPDEEPQRVFAGEARKINLLLHNAGDQMANVEARYRLSQTTSATAVQLQEKVWKKIQVLPGQTVVETAQFDFPAVKAETPFLIQWIEGTNRVFGKTEVLVFPTDLLRELKTLAGENPLGIFDPNNLLKPLLKGVAVGFTDLDNNGLKGFSGRLAIIGPFSSRAQMREGLPNQIESLARKGVAVVWIQPPPGPRDKLQPSFQVVPAGPGCVVVVQAGMVADLPENPRSQLHLLHFSRLALRPEPPRLPQTIQP